MGKRTVLLQKIIFLPLILMLFLCSVQSLYAYDFYWEDPVKITDADSRFPSAATNGQNTYVFWQEIDSAHEQIWISCQYEDSSGAWQTNSRFAGPFQYSGDVPDMYSAAVSPMGTIAVAVLSAVNTISIFVSNDGANTFECVNITDRHKPLVAPRIYSTKTGRFILFTSLGQNESFYMQTAVSDNGLKWSGFSDFQPAKDMKNPFIPVLCSAPDGDYVVFQAQHMEGTRLSYQLYETFSADGGRSWTLPAMITKQQSLPSGGQQLFSNYHNQRPYLYYFNGSVYVAWERMYYTSENAAVWAARIGKNGLVPESAEEISSRGNAKRAVCFSFNNLFSLVWFDTRFGIETVYMAQKNGSLWEETKLSSGNAADMFAFPVITNGGKSLSFVWQENSGRRNRPSAVFRLAPDTTVQPPVIVPLNYTEGVRSRNERVRIRVDMPQDSSGIAGFSWIWTQNPEEEPPEELKNLYSERIINLVADENGYWYFKARVLDYAGNWSTSSKTAYYLDLENPKPPVLLSTERDKFGFMPSNTFSMAWQPDPADDDVAGYTWSLQYLAPIEKRFTESPRHPIEYSDEDVLQYCTDLMAEHSNDIKNAEKPPARILGRNTDVMYKNRRNGLYVFSVAAVDSVGNIGKTTATLLLLNKYIPSTYISSLEKTDRQTGEISLAINGGGFTYDGLINRIYIDRDGVSPYDMILERSDGKFKIVSDSRITGIILGNELEEGSYHIGLLHSDRGLYMSGPVLKISENGTVKIEKEFEYEPSWLSVEKKHSFSVRMGDLLLWIVFVLAAVGSAAAVYGISSTARETITVRNSIQALITGEYMTLENKNKTAALGKRSISLRIKLMVFTSLLVIMIILLVSIPLGFNMTRTEERTLSKGLEDRINVLMESLSSGVRAYMPSQNVLELSYLPSQSSAMEEAEYATITGLSSDGENTGLEYVWATNDPDIREKLNTAELVYGQSSLISETAVMVAERCAALNEKASEEAGNIASDISELNAEGISLALRTDSRSVARREEIAQITTQLSVRLTSILNEISANGGGSIPDFDSSRLDRNNRDYLFYRPVLYRQGSSQNYVRGIILVKITTDVLVDSVDAARRTIILTSVIIALFAIAIGCAGSFFVASVIVNPIRKLANHVAIIGRTKDKEKLAGKDIIIKSRDEIGLLGDTVNEMIHGLVRAAHDEKLLMDGKVVQQTFLPLITDGQGIKKTVAQLTDSKIECFGYYEGASGVSGDYFDYKKLDDRWYVLIKCDASGHGVPAALIMTVVATLFRRYFETWKFAVNGTHIDKLVTQINDFIESLGIKGKFATIIICLFDTATGDVFMCNAGDNIVHIYDSAERKEKILTLFETPAAGPLPSFMVNMKGGFKVEKTNLKPGDVLFLYTDGIEEATRKFRDSAFNVIKCAEPGIPEGKDHANHKVGQESEQMEPERVQAIIEAVFARKVYTLNKYHNPVYGEKLEFDFTTCEGTIEESIIALASVEKVFRMYKDPYVTETDTVRVDKRIDQFLKLHFNMYDHYCGSQREADGNAEPNYIDYLFLKEDEQLDDLTLLAVRRP